MASHLTIRHFANRAMIYMATLSAMYLGLAMLNYEGIYSGLGRRCHTVLKLPSSKKSRVRAARAYL